MRTLRFNRTAPVTVFLWAVLLFSGQTLALAHQHADDAPGTSCAVCNLAKAETAACDTPERAVPAALIRSLPDAGAACRCPAGSPTCFQARGPPQV